VEDDPGVGDNKVPGKSCSYSAAVSLPPNTLLAELPPQLLACMHSCDQGGALHRSSLANPEAQTLNTALQYAHYLPCQYLFSRVWYSALLKRVLVKVHHLVRGVKHKIST
jgi:hypothetical protein